VERTLLDTIKTELAEAVICLTMFEQMFTMWTAPEPPTENDERWWEAVPSELRTSEDVDKMMADIDRKAAEAARERLRSGDIPTDYARRLGLVYARAFVASLRIVRGLLNVVSRNTGIDLSAATKPLD